VPVYSLNTIVEKFNIKEGSVLKIDCEGCEYDLLRIADNDTLRRFNQIIIEYHYGYRELINKLKKTGFWTKYTIPRHIRNGMILGYIYASVLPQV
jgi:hypothetical protein